MSDLPKPITIPMNDRLTFVFVDKGNLDVLDGAFVVVDKNGVRTQIPIGGVACLMLEPGTRISHAAVQMAARVGCLIVWVGDGGVRVYSAGHPGGARSDRLLLQAKAALHPPARLRVVRAMFALRFDEVATRARTVDQLRGMEGLRVREAYARLAAQHGIEWKGRRYDPTAWGSGDNANRCLSAATAALYGVTEAALLAAGYSPAIGFVHSGKPLSFVYDIADLFKFDEIVSAAFAVAATNPEDPERATRLACRDIFRTTRLIERIIPTTADVLAKGFDSILLPEPVVPPAIPEEPRFE